MTLKLAKSAVGQVINEKQEHKRNGNGEERRIIIIKTRESMSWFRSFRKVLTCSACISIRISISETTTQTEIITCVFFRTSLESAKVLIFNCVPFPYRTLFRTYSVALWPLRSRFPTGWCCSVFSVQCNELSYF